MDEALIQLARLRRKGPIWRIVFVVEGFDETFEVFASGRLSKPFATEYAKQNLAKQLKAKRKHVHVQSIRKEG